MTTTMADDDEHIVVPKNAIHEALSAGETIYWVSGSDLQKIGIIAVSLFTAYIYVWYNNA
jgi:hypothetical protein